MDFVVRKIDASHTYEIRQKVLWPDEPLEYCMIESDDTAHHLGGYMDQNLVCVASLFADKNEMLRLRKFAILAHWQNRGLGSKMLRHIKDFVQQNDFSGLWCDSREDALSFYVKNGFQPYGDRFYKNGVAYVKARYLPGTRSC